MPGDQRVGVCATARVADALDLGPAVVAARLDQVDLVEPVLAELGRPQPARRIPGEPLHVAVPVRPDR